MQATWLGGQEERAALKGRVLRYTSLIDNNRVGGLGMEGRAAGRAARDSFRS